MADAVKLTFLGGLGDIGRNCAVLETGGRMVILDCGQMFADETQPGVDSIIPDFSFIAENADRIEACVVTHVHEDHIGGLPYLFDMVPALDGIDIYGSAFTLSLVRHKLAEKNLQRRANFVPVVDHEKRRIGPFDCEFLPVTHSTPMGLISAFTTPQGIILHSSDFKLDHTPVDGRTTDLARIGALSQDPGIRLLLADSTNADSPGMSSSEMEVGGVLRQVFDEHRDQRIIIGAFASHIHRVQQIADAALEQGRTIVTLGRSMKRNVALARDHGLLHIPDSRIVDIDAADDLDPLKTCIISTGSQGEHRSALTLMATGDSRWVTIGPTDTVVFSSHPIPGNEAAVARVRSGLARQGATIVHSGQVDVHTTGHGKRQELLALHSVAHPELFIPVHGEFEHLIAHAELAYDRGMSHDNVLVATDGDQILLDDEGVTKVGRVSGAYVFMDGSAGPLDGGVLDERLRLGQGGFVSVSAEVDVGAGQVAFGPVVASRGWAAGDERFDLESGAATEAREAMEKALANGADLADVERAARRAVGGYVNKVTGRRPVIVPVIRAARR
ncbi:MAG: ribonuclease J [Acidimicrobiales bacterium]|nr:ribonuclease J [Acidimicrobiales bacterium]